MPERLVEVSWFTHAPIPLVVIDGGATIIAANAAWQRAADGDPAGTAADAWLPDEVVEEARDAMRGRRDGLVTATSIVRTRDDPTYRVRVQPLLGDADGTGAGAILAFEDVTSELATERELELVRQLVSLVSHELQTPLMTLLLWERLLRDGSLPTHEHVAALEAIERSAQAMSQLVGELVDVSRAAAGTLEIDTSIVELAPLMRDVHVRAITRALAAEITFDAAIDPDLGAVTGNAIRLQQILDTLVATALRFARSRVSLRARRALDRIEVAVSHDGRGISPAWLPRAFEPFARLDDAEPRSGAGLGLARIDALVALHGGHVTAHSDGCDHGATFTISLPRLDSGR